MDTAELLSKVRKLEIRTKSITREMFSGDYHSAFKGRGMSFSEVRDYQYGDDVRNIDWNVTARTGTPHIKIYEEERELTVMLLIDISASTFYGTISKQRQELIAEIAAILSFSAITNNDKVGAILFSDHVEKYIPPAKGRKNILRIIRELINSEPSGTGTDLNTALQYLTNIQKKKSITFILSDFKTSGYRQALQIAAGKHDIIGLMLYDNTEKNLPDAGLLYVKDRESGNYRWIDSSDAAFRKKWEAAFEKRLNSFHDDFKRSGADTLTLQLEDDYILALHKFFKKRAK
ncbi:MAG: DUF58 domain-containing protein [Saprospiraceae bacterium]|nr:DUF58 domain-containing protein [Saprospiraceae bacterium]